MKAALWSLRRALSAATFVLASCFLICICALAFSTKVTRANFFRLNIGMTLEEVQEIFGETGRDWRTKFQSNPGRGSTRRCWMGDGIAYLVFGKNMRLYHAEWHQDGDLSAAKRAFERVREGMTRAQVQGLFSREPDSAHESEEMWRDYDGEAYVKYAGASVTVCSWFRSRDISLELEYRDREFRRNSPFSWLVSRTCKLN